MNQMLYQLMFPACCCTMDIERSHFIRRCSGNQLAYAHVVSLATAAWFRENTLPESFYIQMVQEDALYYAVIWEPTEWKHSNERRREIAARFQVTDLEYVTKKAIAQRIDILTDILKRTKLFDQIKAQALAHSITSFGEEVYRVKALGLQETLLPITGKIELYIPLEDLISKIQKQ